MILHQGNKSIEFTIVNYQYPEKSPSKEGFDYDANWLMCEVKYSDAKTNETYRIISFASLTSSGALRVTMNWMPITGMNMLNMVPPIRWQSFFREMASLVSRHDLSRKIQSTLWRTAAPVSWNWRPRCQSAGEPAWRTKSNISGRIFPESL